MTRWWLFLVIALSVSACTSPTSPNRGRMFQDANGQWYDDDYNPISDPTPYNVAATQDPLSLPRVPIKARNDPGAATATPDQGAGLAGGSTHAPGPDPAIPSSTDNSSANNTDFQWPSYQLPAPYQFTPFSYDSYTPLTADQAAQTPGYAFGAQQGRDAIQTSAAAKGNVLSGATLKDLFSWGDQFAGQNYQNAETQNENVYNINRGNAFNNWAGNQAGGLASWQANLQPAQFQAASIAQPQAALTFADLFNRFKTSVDSNTAIATAGAS